MKKVTLYIIIFITSFSCKEEVTESLQIVIQNKTDYDLVVKLYPKSEFLSSSLYRISDIGGGHSETQFTLPPSDNYYEWNEVIYVSYDLNIQPHTLTEKVFDSIFISSEFMDDTIVFTKENVRGYSENLFEESSFWNYEIWEDYLHDMGGNNPQLYHCYNFSITIDKLLETKLTK